MPPKTPPKPTLTPTRRLPPTTSLTPEALPPPQPTPAPKPTLTLTPITTSNPEPWPIQRLTPTLTPASISTLTPTIQLSHPHPSPSATPRLTTITPLTPVTAPKPASKPVPRLRQTAEKDPPEKDVVVVEILLTGQEKCVEDWPEDSPQLDPNFKPTRGRRFSFLKGSHKKSTPKARLSTLPHRPSETSSLHNKADSDQMKGWNSYLSPETKGMLLDEGEEDMKKGAGNRDIFVPQRGFAISRGKNEEELKGACGYTPNRDSKGDAFEYTNTANSYTPLSTGKAAVLEEEDYGEVEARLKGDSIRHNMKDCRPEDMLNDCSSTMFAEQLESGEEDGVDFTKQKYHKHKSQKLKTSQKNGFHNGSQMGSFLEDEDFTQSPADLPSGWRTNEDKEYRMDNTKSKKSLKIKGLRKHKAKSKALGLAHLDPPGATSSDYYLSEAAEAEWLATQRDEHHAAGLGKVEEEGVSSNSLPLPMLLVGVLVIWDPAFLLCYSRTSDPAELLGGGGTEPGLDTDSLMEWWNTVEQWDEVPSDDEDVMKEDETKSAHISQSNAVARTPLLLVSAVALAPALIKWMKRGPLESCFSFCLACSTPPVSGSGRVTTGISHPPDLTDTRRGHAQGALLVHGYSLDTSPFLLCLADLPLHHARLSFRLALTHLTLVEQPRPNLPWATNPTMSACCRQSSYPLCWQTTCDLF
ncbi:hypothetical protein N1851_005136 [Merluccius polli]|uniref:Uncharacterized protein n=1 Tax=Merluccius polli TaxID=89951 RepID=A0AA47N7L8_MERPO|nr:hypothetical protein N1851_005136 [Merluccius polli]